MEKIIIQIFGTNNSDLIREACDQQNFKTIKTMLKCHESTANPFCLNDLHKLEVADDRRIVIF